MCWAAARNRVSANAHHGSIQGKRIDPDVGKYMYNNGGNREREFYPAGNGPFPFGLKR